MDIRKNTVVVLKSFLGSAVARKGVKSWDNYWKLIGQKGIIVDAEVNYSGRVLVLFEKNLDDFELENHNPIKNTLWILVSDLEIQN